MTLHEHNRLISILFHVSGALQVLGGLIMIAAFGGAGFFVLGTTNREEEQIVGGILLITAVVLTVLVFGLAILDFYAAFKIGKVQPIGRTLGIVVAILSVLSFPFGTALGAYALWFFFGDGKALYQTGIGNAANFNTPPPPNNWR